MAYARLVCSECGGTLSPADVRCGSCGAMIEGETGGGTRARAKGPSKARPAVQEKKRFEPWQLVAGVAVAGLALFFLYTELSREHAAPVRPAAQQPPPMTSQQPQVPAIDLGPLRKAVDANPSDPAALLSLANALHDTRAFQEAVDVYRKYLALMPNNPDARVDMGTCYFEMGRTDSVRGESLMRTAVAEMERAVADHPRHQAGAYNLGIVNLSMGNIQESNRWFKRAAEIDPATDLGSRARRILEQHSAVQ